MSRVSREYIKNRIEVVMKKPKWDMVCQQGGWFCYWEMKYLLREANPFGFTFNSILNLHSEDYLEDYF